MSITLSNCQFINTHLNITLALNYVPNVNIVVLFARRLQRVQVLWCDWRRFYFSALLMILPCWNILGLLKTLKLEYDAGQKLAQKCFRKQRFRKATAPNSRGLRKRARNVAATNTETTCGRATDKKAAIAIVKLTGVWHWFCISLVVDRLKKM